MPSTPHKELFEKRSGALRDEHPSSVAADSRVELAAHRLAVDFTEDADLPPRFRKLSSSTKSRKTKEDSEMGKRFRANVRSWRQLIEIMCGKICNRQAWRFIDVSPEIGPTVRKVTDCKDFCDFIDYLILRRDKEQCGADELGRLAQLSTAFQLEIEKRIQSLQAGAVAEPAGAGYDSQGA
jgi:hypothetical protein